MVTPQASQGARVNAPDSDIRYHREWLGADEAAVLLARLREDLPWAQHTVRIAGRHIPSPRLSAWLGDPGTTYAYSGTTLVSAGWHPLLREIAERLEGALGERFNSVLANRYRDGRDSMGWHADNEPELGPEPIIASVSLGAGRRFNLRHRRADARCSLWLEHGSLLVMAGPTQQHWRHALPKTREPVGERINLTFRAIRRA